MSFLIYPVIILIINLIYIPSLKYGLISDDSSVMKLNPYNIRRERLINIIIHILVAEYIYLVFKSPISAILFSIHPMVVQVPVFKSGRHHGFDALILLMVLAFIPFTAPLYYYSTFGYPTLTFTPLLFLFTKYWYLSIIAPLLFIRNWKDTKRIFKSKIEGDGIFTAPLPQDFTLHKWKLINLIIVVKTFSYYSLACLLPIKNGFYNSFLSTLGSSDKDTKYWYSLNRHFWGGLFALILMAIIWWFNKFNFIGMGIMIFGLSIGPYLNFVTVQQFTTPRYAYVALIGYQVALIGILTQLGFIGYLIIFGLFVFYLDRLVKVLQHYKKDNITMIMLDSQVFPDNPRLWYYRYEHMLHKNNPIMAWAEASYGLMYLPEDCQLWFGLACASFDLGDMNATIKFLNNSEKFMMLTERENMKSLILELRGRVNKALEDKYINNNFKPNRRF